MDLFDYQYFKFCRLHLQFSGLWPYQTNIIAIPVTIVMILLIITFAITQVTHILKFRGDAEVFLDTFSLILATLHVFILYFNNLFNLGSLKVMLERIKYDWRCAVLNKEDHILEAIMKEGWKYSSYYLTCSYPLMLFLIIVQATPVILNNLFALNISYDRQPIDGEFFVDRDEYFSLIIMYLTFILCASNIITFATNLQFNMLVHHACGMFAIFGYIDTVNSYYSAAFSFLLLFSSLFIANLLVNLCFKIKNMESIDVIVMLTITPHIVVFSDIWASMFMAALSAQKLIDASSGVFQQMSVFREMVCSIGLKPEDIALHDAQMYEASHSCILQHYHDILGEIRHGSESNDVVFHVALFHAIIRSFSVRS
ncbi:uncharacterized protein LOC143259917 isoform X4 [Megalopta genalis]|uniref:uncharacterized protein LOC143259917 isoform X4 n=1 Tax=Megalopta genalis TaxID=115081 RepID=UPI003FD032DE